MKSPSDSSSVLGCVFIACPAGATGSRTLTRPPDNTAPSPIGSHNPIPTRLPPFFFLESRRAGCQLVTSDSSDLSKQPVSESLRVMTAAGSSFNP